MLGNCFDCKFFKDNDDLFVDHITGEAQEGEIFGDCRRYPPVYVGLPPGEHPDNRPYQWEYPQVCDIDYCGEFLKGKKEKPRLGSFYCPECFRKLKDIGCCITVLQANNLLRNGINCIHELAFMTDEQILSLRCVGYKALANIKRELELLGLSLKSN